MDGSNDFCKTLEIEEMLKKLLREKNEPKPKKDKKQSNQDSK